MKTTFHPAFHIPTEPLRRLSLLAPVVQIVVCTFWLDGAKLFGTNQTLRDALGQWDLLRTHLVDIGINDVDGATKIVVNLGQQRVESVMRRSSTTIKELGVDPRQILASAQLGTTWDWASFTKSVHRKKPPSTPAR